MIWRIAVVAGTLALLAAVLLPRPVAAQSDVLLPGTQVRVVAHASSSVRGTVQSVTADTLRLVIHTGGASIALGLNDISELRAIEPRSRLQGAVRGAAIGGVAAGVLLLVDCWNDVDECRAFYETPYDWSDGRVMQGAAVEGALGGMVIGGVIGSIWPGSRQVRIPLPGRDVASLELSLRTSRSGAVVQARIPTGQGFR
jgi:hypothetical protein